jgi:glycolate dehydrogenase FAD-binding subunit
MDMTGPVRTLPGTDQALQDFATQVGRSDPVVAVGGRTQWTVGGDPDPSAREVRAPAGVVKHEPAEMIVRVRAGTPVAELDAALAEGGQTIALDPADAERATVGGVLAVGHSGPRRLGWGPVRDTMLEARFVSAEGQLIRAGGPVVKNVSGFDLCRLLVGSLGTIGLLAEVVLRVRPRPPVAIWLRGAVDDPDHLRRILLRPSSILWDGATTWVLLEGHAADVDAEIKALGTEFAPVGHPPPLPSGGRWSVAPSTIHEVVTGFRPGTFLAEVGVGTVHVSTPTPQPAPPVSPATAALHRRIKANFDPTGRLNPGRTVA